MPGKLIITRGMSGSGKTTWAKDFCAWEPSFRFRVNRDDLRSMLFGGYRQGYEFEQTVTVIQQNAVRELLRKDKIVVVDDTNLALKHAKAFAKLAHEEGASFEVNDEFLSVPLATCIERDAGRDALKRVGGPVIRNQYERFVKQGLQPVVYTPDYGAVPEPYVPLEGTPAAIIVDLDGTMALMGDRGPFEWSKVGQDQVNERVAELVSLIQAAHHDVGRSLHVLFTSGRSEVCRPGTLQWLQEKVGIVRDADTFDADDRIDYEVELFMRPEGDNRKDSEIKLELFNQHIRHIYDVKWVFDDRDQVVQLWRSLGLTCLQVADGAF